MPATRKLMTLALILIALALLYPGVSQPILTLSGTIEKSRVAELGVEMLAGPDAQSQTRQMLTAISSLFGFDQIEGELLVYTNTRSILGTVESLAASGDLLVALLIVFFSLLLPAFKLVLQAVSLFISTEAIRHPLLSINAALSKWSMADVFVMGLLVAFMAGSSADQTGDILAMHASLGTGFYYFLAYCLFSVVAGSLLARPASPAPASPPE